MKLAEALKIIQAAPPDAPPLAIALLCGFAPLHLQTFLRAELCKLFPGRSPRIDTGLYGDLIGNLQRVEGVGTAAALIEWADLDPRLGLRRLGGWEPSQLPDILDEVSRSCERLQEGIAKLAESVPLVLCFPTLPLPPVSFPPLARASEFSLELRSRVAAASAAASRLSAVRIVDPQRIDALSLSRRLDVNGELFAGFPYTLPHASVVAELLAGLIRNPSPMKGLITDLDDTLWRGILGEVGVEGISWDLDHHSQMHGLYQQLLHSLAASGTLIAVASKNEPSLVEQAFTVRDLSLRQSDIFPFEVHWQPKSESVARILHTWNILADDVVFVDDSPMELAEVKAAHPGVECLQFSRDNPQAAYELLEKLRDLFGKDRISSEDSLRVQSLRNNAALQRDMEQSPDASSGEFLSRLGGKLTLSLQKEPLDRRALELVNKTNQFNLNGRRFQETEWQDWLKSENTFVVAASYQDKYGPLGKIAVLAGDLAGSNSSGKRFQIRTWVMSCRAFSRLIEYECLRWLFSKLDVGEMEFDFIETERNAPMRAFLRRICNPPAGSNYHLSRAQFRAVCPALSLTVEELPNG